MNKNLPVWKEALQNSDYKIVKRGHDVFWKFMAVIGLLFLIVNSTFIITFVYSDSLDGFIRNNVLSETNNNFTVKNAYLNENAYEIKLYPNITVEVEADVVCLSSS